MLSRVWRGWDLTLLVSVCLLACTTPPERDDRLGEALDAADLSAYWSDPSGNRDFDIPAGEEGEYVLLYVADAPAPELDSVEVSGGVEVLRESGSEDSATFVRVVVEPTGGDITFSYVGNAREDGCDADPLVMIDG